jgi:hypothetical protein
MADPITPEDGGNGDAFTPITSQDELDRVLSKRLERERSKFADYSDLQAKAKRLDEIEEASKSELDKATARAEAAEKALADITLERDRVSVAATVLKDVELAPLLSGATKADIEKSAELLAARLAPQKTKPSPTSLKSGASGSDGSGMTAQERAASAIRAMRGTA